MKILLKTNGISAISFYISGTLERSTKSAYHSIVSFFEKKMYLFLISKYLLEQISALQTAATLEVAAVISVTYVSQNKVFLFASFLILFLCTSRENRLNSNLLIIPRQFHKQDNRIIWACSSQFKTLWKLSMIVNSLSSSTSDRRASLLLLPNDAFPVHRTSF